MKSKTWYLGNNTLVCCQGGLHRGFSLGCNLLIVSANGMVARPDSFQRSESKQTSCHAKEAKTLLNKGTDILEPQFPKL